MDEVRALDDQPLGQASKLPPLYNELAIPQTGKSQDPCAPYQAGDRICVKEKSVMCEKKLGQLASGTQEHCLSGCDEWTGKCREEVRALDDQARGQASKPPPVSE